MKLILTVIGSLFFKCLMVGGEQEKKTGVDLIFKEWDNDMAPGMVVGIIQDGELIHSKGYGLANLETNTKITSKSVFRIASASKQFTAASIILLANNGKLKLDESISRFFPEFPSYAKKITVQQLLNHTSGIRDYLTLAFLAGYGSQDVYGDHEINNWLKNQTTTNFPPGEQELYSNSGYWLLGQIVKISSGKDLPTFALENIFKPLGMKHTAFVDDHRVVIKNKVSSYLATGSGSFLNSRVNLFTTGDGGVLTTLEDLKKWDDNFYDPIVGGEKFIELMLQRGKLNDGRELNYASGLVHGEYKGLKTVMHGGAYAGFRSEIMRFPEKNLSVVILGNRSDLNPTALAYEVANVYLEDSFVDKVRESDMKSVPKSAQSIKLSREHLRKFQGSYWNESSGLSRNVYYRNDTLRYTVGNGFEMDLIPISENRFLLFTPQNKIEVSFSSDQENLNMSLMPPNGATLSFIKYQPVDYSIQQLRLFEGDYYSNELNVQYSIKLKDNRLSLKVDGIESRLEAVMPYTFSSRAYGIIRFSKDFSEFGLSLGRVRNLKFVGNTGGQ